MFVAGTVVLGLVDVGYVPAAAAAGALPILLLATGLMQFVSTLWAAALGQTLVACIFGLFAAFWWSYCALVLGLAHNWFAIPAADVERTVAAFLITWTVVMVALTVATFRLPALFTAVVGLVVVALLLLLFATTGGSTSLTKIAGYVLLTLAALGTYLFLNAASLASGGRGYPLGALLLE